MNILLRALVIIFLSSSFFSYAYGQVEAHQAYSQITASAYCDFLNREAAEDPYHFFDQAMSSDPDAACIVRLGTPGNYFYQVLAGREKFPICYVNKSNEDKYEIALNYVITSDEQNSQIFSETFKRSLKSNRSGFQVPLSNSNQMLLFTTSATSGKNDSLLSGTTFTEICLIFTGGMMLRAGDHMMISEGEDSSIQSHAILAESPNRVSASTLEQKIGYKFNNPRLLNEALTHSSSLNERVGASTSNERLEHLGDAVLQLMITEHLFNLFPNCNEGELTEKRAELVSKNALKVYASRLQLGEYLIMGRGEEGTGGRAKSSILANSFEALIGAIYQDGGMEVARAFVVQHAAKEYLNNALEEVEKIRNPKGNLQELLQAYGWPLPHYQLLDQVGLDHIKQFRCGVFCQRKKLGEGEGSTKKEAETAAAKQAIISLRENIRKSEETAMFEGNENKAMGTNSIEKEKEQEIYRPNEEAQGIYQSDAVAHVESIKTPAVLENSSSDAMMTSFTKAEFNVSQYRNKATQAEAAGHFDQARWLNNSADFMIKASTMKSEGKTEEAALWLQAAQEALVASKAYIMANSKGKRPLEEAIIGFGSTYGVYLTADTSADIASYVVKAAETRAAGNQQISGLWLKAARELKMVIVKRQAHSAWDAAYRFATTVEYLLRAEDGKMIGHLKIADLWAQAATRSEVAAEKLSLLAQSLPIRGKNEDQLDNEARFSEHLARASERTAWAAIARVAENEELADLWIQAAREAKVEMECEDKITEAYKAKDMVEVERLKSILYPAQSRRYCFVKNAIDQTKKNPPIVLASNKTKKPRQSYFAKYR